MPYFSIILPTFNRASHLSKAIDSVINQEFVDWELIIIDDGSTDNTREIVAQKQIDESRIKYIFQENAERSVARNNGVNYANGSFICFLDSDDSYLSDYLINLFHAIQTKENQVALYISGVVTIDGDKKINSYPKEQNYKNFSTYFFKESIIPNRVCVAKLILEKYHFDPLVTISEDTQLWVAIVNAGYPCYLLDFSSVVYYVHEENSVNVKKANVYLDRQNTLYKILKADTKKIIDRKIAKQTINDCYWGIFFYNYFQKNNMIAILTLVKSMIHYPNYRLKEKMFTLGKVLIRGKL